MTFSFCPLSLSNSQLINFYRFRVLFLLNSSSVLKCLTITDPGWNRLGHVFLREHKDRHQLIALLHDAKERELLDQDALAMIEGILKISGMKKLVPN